ncbi:MAG TPA: RsmG family class I SAM-dependent methyltransferase [Acidimicrobiia bacterium]|nr:RsmG family class I SAM-dependent methyltransferase [Acidimicrobiia bacterium]
MPFDDLRLVLERARIAGFLGPGPVEPHIRHSEGFAAAAEDALDRPPTEFADLGTGGGIPGLVLGVRWADSRGAFIETGQRRCAWLREAVQELGLGGSVSIVEDRAEAVGRTEDSREAFELVTARSFAGPAVTAEIAAGLVRVGGVLVVSEPPDRDPDRWPSDGLQGLGFAPAQPVEVSGAHFVVVRKTESTPERFPRGIGRPTKRPIW